MIYDCFLRVDPSEKIKKQFPNVRFLGRRAKIPSEDLDRFVSKVNHEFYSIGVEHEH